jgi:hypothetical protein
MSALNESRESYKGFGILRAEGNHEQLEDNRADWGHKLKRDFQLFRTGFRSLLVFWPRPLNSSL